MITLLLKVLILYIFPLKYFVNKKVFKYFRNFKQKISNFIFILPTIIKANYRNLLSLNIENAIKSYNIKGFVLSNISNLLLLDNVLENCSLNKNNFNFIANYTFNIFNNHSVKELKELGLLDLQYHLNLIRKNYFRFNKF